VVRQFGIGYFKYVIFLPPVHAQTAARPFIQGHILFWQIT